MDETKPLIESLPAQNIPGVELLGIVGSGGMAKVYKARHLIMDETVAVKIISASALGDEGTQRFMREAKRTAALAHPNIVQVNSAGMSSDGNPYIVMEFLEGQALSSFIESGYQFSPDELRAISKDVLSALSFAHQQGVIHRDIKPGNIIISGSPSNRTAKVVDFGIARSFTDDGVQKLTKSGYLLGTPAYMSPEQCNGSDLGPRSDLYSFGAVIFECIVGRKLFVGDNSLDVMYQHLNSPPDFRGLKELAGLKIYDLLDRVLAKDPAKRPSDAKQFAAELDEALKQTSISKRLLTSESGKSSSASKSEIRNGRILAFVLPVFVGMLFGAGLVYSLQHNVNSNSVRNITIPADNENVSRPVGLRVRDISADIAATQQTLDSAKRLQKMNLKSATDSYVKNRETCDRLIEKQWNTIFKTYNISSRTSYGLANCATQYREKLRKEFDKFTGNGNTDKVTELKKRLEDYRNLEVSELQRASLESQRAVEAAYRAKTLWESEEMYQELKFVAYVSRKAVSLEWAINYLNGQMFIVSRMNKDSPMLDRLRLLVEELKGDARAKALVK